MKTKILRKLATMRRYINTNEEKVLTIFQTLSFTTLFIMALFVIALITSCGQKEVKAQTDKDTINTNEFVDITYINPSTILPHDTVAFKTAEEEYQFLREQNKFLQELLHNYNEIKDNLDAVMWDGIDEECNYPGKDILEWLYMYYESYSINIDKLYKTQE